jgi:hypothetical protein
MLSLLFILSTCHPVHQALPIVPQAMRQGLIRDEIMYAHKLKTLGVHNQGLPQGSEKA